MEGGKGWKKYLNQFCNLIYQDGVQNDGKPHFSKKQGLIVDFNSTHLFIKEETVQGIRIESILRIELEEVKKNDK